MLLTTSSGFTICKLEVGSVGLWQNILCLQEKFWPCTSHAGTAWFCLGLPLVQQLVTALPFLEAYSISGYLSISVNSAIYHNIPFANYLWPLYGMKIYSMKFDKQLCDSIQEVFYAVVYQGAGWPWVLSFPIRYIFSQNNLNQTKSI